MDGGYVAKPSNGWYCRVDRSTGELVEPKVREKDTLTLDFWSPILDETDFKDYVKKRFSIAMEAINEGE